MLDLTTYYNELLPGQGQDMPGSRFRVKQPGTHTWDGMKFDVRGMVNTQKQSDRRITGIAVGQKCSKIAFLHAANYHQSEKISSFSRFVVHFANGHTETVRLVFGKDLARSLFSANPPELNSAMTNSVVWSEIIPSGAAPQPLFVFYLNTWRNPLPEETVASIDFIPDSMYAGEMLVAITVQPRPSSIK
jgi:hypothetical protein